VKLLEQTSAMMWAAGVWNVIMAQFRLVASW